MKIVALGQQKGGVGKSAAAINLSTQAVAAGFKVALVDMDFEQGTSAKWGERRDGKEWPRVEKANAISLTPLLKGLEAGGIDWVFLDLPGRNAPLASAGLAVADLIIVPVRPLDVDIEASVVTVQAAKRAKRPYAYLMNIAPPQVDQKRAKQVAGTLAALGHKVSPVIIVQRITEVADPIAKGLAANEAYPKKQSAAEFHDLFAWIRQEIGQ